MSHLKKGFGWYIYINMVYLITESQLKVIVNEQSMGGMLTPQSFARQSKEVQKMNPHTLMTIAQIGSAFIPYVGPLISAGIGLADAKMYYDEGEKKTAGIVAALSAIPFIGPLASKIPGVKQLGSKGISALASKLSKGSKLTKSEAEISGLLQAHNKEIQQELVKLTPKLKSVVNDLQAYKGVYIKKYGQRKYNELITKYLYGGIDKKTLLNTVKSVKNPTLRLKPIMGQGADHVIYDIVSRPDLIIKVEKRAGEINKWYDLFARNPKIFPKVIKKVPLKYKDGKTASAVVMEKLNTQSFMKLWDDVEKVLHSTLPSKNRMALEHLLKNIKTNRSYANIWKKTISEIQKKSPNIKNQVNNLNSLVENLYKMSPKPDIRKFNFGYDKSGVLKALDI